MKFQAVKQRYTLRKEYFGGILHDAKTQNIELLSLDECKTFSCQLSWKNRRW